MSGPLLVIPVKATLGAKQRLAARLPLEPRRVLALAMASDVLRVAVEVAGAGAVLVVAGDDDVVPVAERSGVAVVRERGAGQSAAVALGARWAVEHGHDAIATVAADCPLVEGDDIERLLEAAGSPGRHLHCAPDAEGRGTNAAALRPADVEPWRFGPDSLRRHREAAAGLGLRFELLDLPSLRLDCDRGADLDSVLEAPRQTATYHLLRQVGVAGGASAG